MVSVKTSTALPLLSIAAVSALVLSGCAASTDAASDTASGSGSAEMHEVDHVFGTTEIPVDPQRVVVLDSGSTLEAVLALGVTPVGTLVPKLTGDFPDFIADKLPDDLLVLGNSEGEPNREQILNAAPDLIIVPTELGGQRESFEDVADLAPTIAVDDTAVNWKETLTALGGYLGAEDEAQTLLDDYNARVAEVREVLGDDPGTMSVVRARADRLNYMGQNGAFIWSALTDVGFEAPAAQDRGDEEDSFFEVSLENTDLLDADRILVVSDAPIDDEGGYLASVRSNPLFARLTGEVDYLPSSEYLFGNILKANQMLDYLAAGD